MNHNKWPRIFTTFPSEQAARAPRRAAFVLLMKMEMAELTILERGAGERERGTSREGERSGGVNSCHLVRSRGGASTAGGRREQFGLRSQQQSSLSGLLNCIP